MGSDSASLEQGPHAGLVSMSQRIDLEQMHVGRPRGGLAALVIYGTYTLVNIQKAMENHHL